MNYNISKSRLRVFVSLILMIILSGMILFSCSKQEMIEKGHNAIWEYTFLLTAFHWSMIFPHIVELDENTVKQFYNLYFASTKSGDTQDICPKDAMFKAYELCKNHYLLKKFPDKANDWIKTEIIKNFSLFQGCEDPVAEYDKITRGMTLYNQDLKMMIKECYNYLKHAMAMLILEVVNNDYAPLDIMNKMNY